MSCTVRPREDEDLPALAGVLVRVHERDGYPVEGVSDPIGWLDYPQALASWTAVLDDGPVGQVALASANSDNDTARVWAECTGGIPSELAVVVRLFVDIENRAVGAGRMLMAAALDHAHSLGCSVALDVMAKDRAAIRLYERCGGQRLGYVAHHYGDGLTERAIIFGFPPPAELTTCGESPFCQG